MFATLDLPLIEGATYEKRCDELAHHAIEDNAWPIGTTVVRQGPDAMTGDMIYRLRASGSVAFVTGEIRESVLRESGGRPLRSRYRIPYWEGEEAGNCYLCRSWGSAGNRDSAGVMKGGCILSGAAKKATDGHGCKTFLKRRPDEKPGDAFTTPLELSDAAWVHSQADEPDSVWVVVREIDLPKAKARVHARGKSVVRYRDQLRIAYAVGSAEGVESTTATTHYLLALGPNLEAG
jgi:hypothetical protein